MQATCQNGLPGDAIGKRKIYNLLYKGKDSDDEGEDDEAAARTAQSADNEPHDPTQQYVDRSGFGFGPFKGGHKASSPYTKTSSKAGCEPEVQSGPPAAVGKGVSGGAGEGGSGTSAAKQDATS